MRKRIFSVLTAVVLTASVVAGCSNKKVDEPTTSEKPTEETTTQEATTARESSEMTADIVIIGATGAGLTAAVQAVEEGTKPENILILEKGAAIDDSVLKHMEAFNAAESDYQINAGVEDDIETFGNEIKTVGTDTIDGELSTYMSENAADALSWLAGQGVELTTISQDNGSGIPRSHRTGDGSPAGELILKAMADKVKELAVPITYGADVSEIVLNEEGEVSAVKAATGEGDVLINCRAVVLADGGFGANKEMVKQYKADFAEYPSVSIATSDGTGINLAKQAGAAVVNMDQIQLYPLVDTQKKILVTEDLYRSGAILANKEGQRFVSEKETENRIATAISLQTDGKSFVVFDDEVKKNLPVVDDYVKAGIVKEADTVADLAKAIGVDAAALEAEAKEATGLSKTKFYAIECEAAVYYTLGGVKINTCAEVLTEDEGTIPGLFAAGEVTGGVHGSNVLDGNILTEMVVFGRTAGVEASGYADSFR